MNKTETKEIRKVTIEAISIKKENKLGVPYTWKDKKRNNAVTPRTRVSIKVGKTDDDWLLGWSYKDGSAAESLKNGDVVEILVITEVEEGGKVWKSWKFPKEEDKQAIENAELKRKLAAFEAGQGQAVVVPYTGAASSNSMSMPAALSASNPSAQSEPEF